MHDSGSRYLTHTGDKVTKLKRPWREGGRQGAPQMRYLKTIPD